MLAALGALTALLAAACAGNGSVASRGSGTGTAGTRSAPPPAGTSTQTINVGGRARTYRVYRPTATTTTSAGLPLVVMLHGGYGSAGQAEASYGWDAEADAGRFLVVYPDGVGRAWNVGGGCCGQPARDGVDDAAFVAAAVRDVEARLPVDADRVFATGISNGGMLAYRLACDTRLFAAIGPDSATLLGPCPTPKPLSVIHIHGSADTRVPYNGGPGDGRARIDGPAVPAVIAGWRTVDGCGAPRSTTTPAAAGAGAVTTSLATCPDGRAVELVTIDGAGHQWPGAPGRPLVQELLGTDPPSTALDATDVIWRFFAAHPRPAGVAAG